MQRETYGELPRVEATVSDLKRRSTNDAYTLKAVDHVVDGIYLAVRHVMLQVLDCDLVQIYRLQGWKPKKIGNIVLRKTPSTVLQKHRVGGTVRDEARPPCDVDNIPPKTK